MNASLSCSLPINPVAGLLEALTISLGEEMVWFNQQNVFHSYTK
jgi:hypothetical protein